MQSVKLCGRPSCLAAHSSAPARARKILDSAGRGRNASPFRIMAAATFLLAILSTALVTYLATRSWIARTRSAQPLPPAPPLEPDRGLSDPRLRRQRGDRFELLGRAEY